MQDDFDLSALVSNKKKRKNSRTKGNTFERKVCAILNKFFQTDEFMRSPGSGAFSTTHKLPDHLKFSGDLITPKNFKFTIECKKGYNKENLGSLFNPKSEFMNFIAQAERDSKKINKNFLLIFQQDRKDILCLFNSHKNYSLKHFIESYYSGTYISISMKDETYLICKLETLLSIPRIDTAFKADFFSIY